MDKAASSLVDLIKIELPTGTELAVHSFLSAYWQLSDQQVNWSSPVGVALNNLAERLEYFDPTENPSFPGAVTLADARKMMNEVLTLAASTGL